MSDATPEILTKNVKLVKIDSVSPHPGNVRQGDIGAIGQIIKKEGFWGALLVQKSTGLILKGNHSWHAAKQVGLAEVPVIFVDVDDAKARRILLADNRASDLAMYDEPALAEMLKEVIARDGSLEGTGYAPEDLDELLFHLAPTGLEGFQSFTESMEVDHKCPSCGYEWKGQAKQKKRKKKVSPAPEAPSA